MSPTPIQRGVIDPQAAAGSGLSIFFRGLTNDEFILEGVHCPGGSLLVCYLILFSDGGIVPDSNVTLDGVSMVRSPFIDGWFDSSRTILTQVYTRFIPATIEGNLVVFEDEQGLQAIALYAFTVEGGPPTMNYAASGDDSDISLRPGPIDCPIMVPPASIVMLADFQLNHVATGGDYGAGGVLLRSDHLTGGVDTGMMSFGVFAAPSTGINHPTRQLLGGLPAVYFGHAMAFSP